MTDIVIVGAGGHARVVADVIQLLGTFRVTAFVEGDESLADRLHAEGVANAVVAIGDNRARARIGEALMQHGIELPVLAHPAAVIAAGVQIGAGTVVFAGGIINPGAVIGKHVIVNTAATIDHDCVIGDGAHIAVGAHLAGNVSVEARVLLGIGAVVRPGIRIGQDAVVGAGAAVVRDVAADTTVAGVPARELS